MIRGPRTVLLVPGADAGAIAAAPDTEADQVLLDLDDTVPPSAKTRAREMVIDALTTLDWGERSIAVRVNAPSTAEVHRDVMEILTRACVLPDVLCIPRMHVPAELTAVDWLVRRLELELECRAPIALQAQVETAAGLSNAVDIIAASERVTSVVFGAGDFVCDMGLPLASPQTEPSLRNAAGWTLKYARLATVIAARTAGVIAIDGPHYAPINEFAAHCSSARGIGYDGVWCVNEEQVTVARDLFGTPRAELEQARSLLAEARAADRHAQDGYRHYDAAVVRDAQRALTKEAAVAREPLAGDALVRRGRAG
jgi:citrate lyase beta subunit